MRRCALHERRRHSVAPCACQRAFIARMTGAPTKGVGIDRSKGSLSGCRLRPSSRDGAKQALAGPAPPDLRDGYNLYGRLATLGNTAVKRKSEEIRAEFSRCIAEEPGGKRRGTRRSYFVQLRILR